MIIMDTCKMRNETETKSAETKPIQMKQIVEPNYVIKNWIVYHIRRMQFGKIYIHVHILLNIIIDT